MKEQAGLGELTIFENPNKNMLAMQWGTIIGYIKSKDNKIVGVNVLVNTIGPLPIVAISSPTSDTFHPPQINDVVVVGFINGDQSLPFIVTSLYNLDGTKLGSDSAAPFIKLLNGINIITDKNGKLQIQSNDIEIGTDPTEPAVLGTTLKGWLESHTHPTGVGPSGTPMSTLPSGALSQKVKIK